MTYNRTLVLALFVCAAMSASGQRACAKSQQLLSLCPKQLLSLCAKYGVRRGASGSSRRASDRRVAHGPTDAGADGRDIG